ncbi:MFS transporter [Novosphingobium sp.]|uniref:MFS transporter n=1 Tax=Novosphingobium sp. TaxID=1874826 RepID=UPI001ECE7824|nr:MFS transporter [Novosphingobium sp.]MBK9011783.1 MFS transporter [Novosphingobium sp.]
MSVPTHPLQFRDYRLIWLTRFFSTSATTAMVVVIGAQVYQTARVDYAMDKAEAAFLLGLLGLIQFIPFLLLTPVAGLLADRMDRRHVAAAATAVDLVIGLVLAAANAWDFLSLPLLFSMAALYGAARVFIGPAVSAITPNVVPAELLPKAIAISSIAWQAGAVFGPALGGFMLAHDPALPYWYSATILLLAIGAVLAIRHRAPPAAAKEPPLKLMAEGAKFVWHERFLLGCVTLDLFAVLLGGATAMLPAFAYDVLPRGSLGLSPEEMLGIMRGAPALGAALVALYLGFRPIAHNVGAKMLWAVAVYGLATLVFGLSTDFLLSLASLSVLGAADAISVFVRNTLIQLNTPDDKRGRVSSISGLAISASNELGEMQSGLAAAFLGPVAAVALGGAGAIVITAIWTVLFPELKRAKTFAPQYRNKEEVS